MRSAPLLALVASTSVLVACAPARGSRCCAPSRAQPTPVAPAPERVSVLRDGSTGREVPWSAFDALLARSDVIAFGELHDDPEGSRAERRVWERMTAKGERPAVLAMEFFERDVQADLDAYLAGTIEEAEMVKRARQGKGYAAAHRPLIEHAKAHGRPVVAANAPRRLVTAYRKQDAAYEAWKAALPEADRGWLPRTTTTPDDAYRARFMGLMGEERGSKIFKAQALWDDAMAEAVADRRAAHPDERVLLVVGAFHVTGRLGTLTKLAERRPGDRVGLVVMTHGEGPDLTLPADLRGQADLVLVVRAPAPEPKQAAPAKAETPTAGSPPAPQPPVPAPVKP